MKKLILIALAFVSIQAFAQPNEGQNKKKKMHKMHNLTPEQAATMKTKRMTLHLDLNEKQQKEIYAIMLANAEARKAKMEEFKAKRESGEMKRPTAEERFKMAEARLDHQIAMKAKMKDILNEEQFAKWEKAQARMAHKAKQKKGEMKKGGNKKRPE